MIPKSLKQCLKYNPLLLPKEHKQTSQQLNIALWGQITTINSNFPKEQIVINHILKEFGSYYTLDMELICKNKVVQTLLDAAYKNYMHLPRFEKPTFYKDMAMEE